MQPLAKGSKDGHGIFSPKFCWTCYCATKPYIVDLGIGPILLIQVEVFPIRKMIEVAISSGFQSDMFEGDSLKIVQALKNKGSCLNRFGQIKLKPV